VNQSYVMFYKKIRLPIKHLHVNFEKVFPIE